LEPESHLEERRPYRDILYMLLFRLAGFVASDERTIAIDFFQGPEEAMVEWAAPRDRVAAGELGRLLH
jgi:hypothetical protein